RAVLLPARFPSPARYAASATGAANRPDHAWPARAAPCLRSARFPATASGRPGALPIVPACPLPSVLLPGLHGAFLPVAAVLPAPAPAASGLLPALPAFPPAACAYFPDAQYRAATGHSAPVPDGRDVLPDC